MRNLLICLAALLVGLSYPASLSCQDRLVYKTDKWEVTPDVNALDDYMVMPNSTGLARMMTRAAEYNTRWQLPRNNDEWQNRRTQIRGRLLKEMGLDPLPERTPLNVKKIKLHQMDGYTIETMVYYSRPDFPVTAALFRPDGPVPEGGRPAVVVPPGHTLKIGKAYFSYYAACIKLAKLGFVVLTYDAIGHGERCAAGNTHHEAGFALLPLGETVLGWMVWDSMRGIDYLQSLPDVDPERIGITGNSGGGLNSLYTAVVDERIKSAAPAGYLYDNVEWIKYSGPNCTCCYVPEQFRYMDLWEIEGLIAPRPTRMLQGSYDYIFPVSGSRLAGRKVEALYDILGIGDKADYYEIPKYPHGYAQPFREAAYGWMMKNLMGKGDGSAIPEGEIKPLTPEEDYIYCYPPGSLFGKVPSVTDLAYAKGLKMVEQLPPLTDSKHKSEVEALVTKLTAPPSLDPDFLIPNVIDSVADRGTVMEKVYFVSEMGQHIPGLFWIPKGVKPPYKVVIVVDDKGKAAVAESDLVDKILKTGHAVLSVDLRGRGETLGKINNGDRTNNFAFATVSMSWGEPLSGRRAFDISRTIDYLETRDDISFDDLTLIGNGSEALSALLATAKDQRIKKLAMNGYLSSFVSQIRPEKVSSWEEWLKVWNPMAMNTGYLNAGEYTIDLGAVIPGVLQEADIPDILSLVAPRKVLVCDLKDKGLKEFGSVFEKRLQAAGSTSWLTVSPTGTLSSGLLGDLLK